MKPLRLRVWFRDAEDVKLFRDTIRGGGGFTKKIDENDRPYELVINPWPKSQKRSVKNV